MNAFTSDNPQLPLLNCGDQQAREAVLPDRLQSIAIADAAPAVASYIEAALSENTRRAYRTDLADFLSWPGGGVPCSPDLLAAYIAERAVSLSPFTITRRVVAIARAHTTQGLSNPATSDLVRTVLRGVRKAHGTPQRQAVPLLRDDLLCILPRRDDIRSVRDRALILLGFASAMRRSELVALDVPDLRFVGQGLEIHIRRSKTDQEGHGRKIAVPCAKTGACPVVAVQLWLEQAEISEGSIFRSIGKGGRVKATRLTAQSINLILRRRVIDAGGDPVGLSAHSLRSGLVTSAAQAGIPVHKIQAQTGHRSLEMLNRYVRDASLFSDNAASVL